MKTLSNTELTTFCSQFSLILRSGISSLEGLSIMLEDTPEGDGTVLLKGMIATMEETGSLYEALITSKVFPPYLCSMVEIGEQSGRLDDVMASLSEHYHREEEMARNIKSAVTYPLVMLGMMMVVIFVLIVKVLPVFNEVFSSLAPGLPGSPGRFSPWEIRSVAMPPCLSYWLSCLPQCFSTLLLQRRGAIRSALLPVPFSSRKI